jgi:hypothetical protein
MDFFREREYIMAIHYPPVFINCYLQDKLPDDSMNNSIPFFPTTPSNLDELTQSYPDGLFGVYDRMFKLRRTPFPHLKYEQLLYYFYKTTEGPAKLIETVQYVSDLLDRGDESAQELNAWTLAQHKAQGSQTSTGTNIVTGETKTYNKVSFGGTDFLLPYFHEFKIFQLEEARDIVDFGTARTYAGNKLIIDYCWHESDPLF